MPVYIYIHMLKIVEVHGVGSILWLSTDLKKAYIKASGCVPKESKNNLEYVSAEWTCFSHWPSNTAGPLYKKGSFDERDIDSECFERRMEAQKSTSKRTLTLFYGQIQTQDLQKIHTRFVTGCPLAISSMWPPGVGPKGGYCSFQRPETTLIFRLVHPGLENMSGKLQKASG